MTPIGVEMVMDAAATPSAALDRHREYTLRPTAAEVKPNVLVSGLQLAGFSVSPEVINPQNFEEALEDVSNRHPGLRELWLPLFRQSDPLAKSFHS